MVDPTEVSTGLIEVVISDSCAISHLVEYQSLSYRNFATELGFAVTIG